MRRICPEKVVFSFRDALENRENIKIFIVLGGFEKWSEILRRLGNIRKKIIPRVYEMNTQSSIIVATVHFWTSLRFELSIKFRSNIFHMNTNQS